MLTLQLLVCTLIGAIVILLPSAALAQIYRQNECFGKRMWPPPRRQLRVSLQSGGLAAQCARSPEKGCDRQEVHRGDGRARRGRECAHCHAQARARSRVSRWRSVGDERSAQLACSLQILGDLCRRVAGRLRTEKAASWLPGDGSIRNLWWMYPAAMAPMHVANGIRSMHTQPPACAASECQ